MITREIKPGIASVGVLDFQRRLFDALVPTPEGTSYNAYLVRGDQKTALIDTVDPESCAVLLANLEAAQVTHLDYVVLNHAEQDHSGSLPAVLERYPAAQVVVNDKCRDQLTQFFPLPAERVLTVRDRQTLELGGKTLEFIFAPWVHWPETMFTYLREDQILFSCDFLGSHLATSDLFGDDPCQLYEPAKRYYAEIMMPFRAQIKGHLAKLEGLPLAMVAPSHGPVYRDPRWILSVYREWTADAVKNEVVLPYVSMHGSTEKMAARLRDALMLRGVGVHPFDLARADIGKLAMALVEAATVVFASPTVLMGPHPLAVTAAYLTNALRPKTRFMGVIGSYGWGGKTVEVLTQMLSQLKAEPLPPVFIKGSPKGLDLAALDQLADQIAERHRQLA